MDVEADGMAEAVDEILSERLAVQVFAVGVDVVVGDFVDGVGIVALHVGLAGDEGRSGGFLRAEDDVVNFALARCEVAVDGQGAGDVGGVHGILGSGVDDDDVA